VVEGVGDECRELDAEELLEFWFGGGCGAGGCGGSADGASAAGAAGGALSIGPSG